MPALHAVIAASDYRADPRPAIRPLAGAEADARSMAALLAGSPIAGGELGGLTLLLGPQATTRGLREAIARGVAATTATGDTLLVFFAGHGLQREDGLVLFTADGEYAATQLVEDCGTDREPIAVILDCCHAGAVAASKGAAVEEDRRDQMIKLHLDQLQFICSAAADQRAFEREGRGVFTRKLVEVLGAPSDPALLALPMDVATWCYMLPKDLLDTYDIVEGGRDLLQSGNRPVGSQGPHAPTPPRQTYVTEGPTDTAATPGDPSRPSAPAATSARDAVPATRRRRRRKADQQPWVQAPIAPNAPPMPAPTPPHPESPPAEPLAGSPTNGD